MNDEEYYEYIEKEIKKHESCDCPVDIIWGKSCNDYFRELCSVSFRRHIEDVLNDWNN